MQHWHDYLIYVISVFWSGDVDVAFCNLWWVSLNWQMDHYVLHLCELSPVCLSDCQSSWENVRSSSTSAHSGSGILSPLSPAYLFRALLAWQTRHVSKV